MGPATEAGYSEAPILIERGDKGLVLGDYKMGKTLLVRHLLAVQPRTWVFDPTFAFPGGVGDIRQAAMQFQQTGKAVYQPGRRDLAEKLDEWCEVALRLHNCLTFVDEPTMAGKVPQSLEDLHRLGHKRGVGVFFATHSLWDVPHVLQQANHFFVFHIDRVVEVNALRQLLPDEAVEWIRQAPRYEYWHKGTVVGGESESERRHALQVRATVAPKETQRPING